MTPTPTRRAGIVLAAVAAAALAGCDVPTGSTLTFDATEPAKVTEIVLAGGSGAVTVSTAPGTGTHVRRVVRGGTDPGEPYRLAGSVLTVDTTCGPRCTSTYEIQAPPGVTVRGGLGSGDVTLTGVASGDVRVGSGDVRVAGASGAVTVVSGSGDVTVDGVAGAVNAGTGSGDVLVTAAAGGPVRVDSGSGDVDVRLSAARAVTVDVDSGDATVSVPPGRYRLTAEARSGDRTVAPEITGDPAASLAVSVRTGSGDVTVTTR